jgi:hypothetical protein
VAKQCTYCGRPLAKEDARFCDECGRLQIPEPDPMAPGVIKVRLPPKEIYRREPPPSLESIRFERTPRSSQVGQHQREQPASAPPSSRLAKRPVRLTTEESQRAAERSERPGESAPVPTHESKEAPPLADKSIEELSTMVLPGWREELERLRKKQEQAKVPEAQADPSPLNSSTPPQVTENTPPALRSEKAREALSGGVSPEQVQGTRTPDGPATDSIRRELRVKVWEQEPTIQYPQVQIEKKEIEPGPAPAVEHAPFVAAFEEEKEVETVVDVGSVDQQVLSNPALEPEPAPAVEENMQREKEVKQAEAKERGVEDLPTIPLAVPEAAKQPPAITIERASTPAPKKRTTSQEEIENLPTRPMPASQAGPRSPLPPAAPQPLQSRVQEQREAPRSTPVSMVPNPPSSPGVYRQSSAVPVNAAQAPGSPFSPPATPGRVHNPQSQPGQVFERSGMSTPPQGPLSSPGNTMFRPQPPSTPQRAPAFAPPTPPPVTPARPTAGTESAPAKPRKRRVKPLRVALLVLLVLAIGAGAFVYYYQSSSGGTVAQPYQTFQNSALGVSLDYPQGWTAGVNQTQTSVHFADSSQTGQVTLSVTGLNAQSLTQYIDQEATHLGITTPQSEPPIMFGGASWQQVQGNVVQGGVTYLLDLCVTQHGTHIYSLIFMAPPPVYGRMDQEDFAPLRTSFRFI